MNQNSPNPRLALRCPHPCSLPIEWGNRDCPPNVNLRPRVVLDTQVWLPARDGDERSCPLAVALWLTPEEIAWQRLWREQRNYNRLRAQSGRRKQREQTHRHQFPQAFSGILACGSGGYPGYEGWPLTKINSFHNNFWFDSKLVYRHSFFHIIFLIYI